MKDYDVVIDSLCLLSLENNIYNYTFKLEPYDNSSFLAVINDGTKRIVIRIIPNIIGLDIVFSRICRLTRRFASLDMCDEMTEHISNMLEYYYQDGYFEDSLFKTYMRW